MSPDAALAALAGALEPFLADDAPQAARAALRELHRDGWHITPDPQADDHRSPRRHPTVPQETHLDP